MAGNRASRAAFTALLMTGDGAASSMAVGIAVAEGDSLGLAVADGAPEVELEVDGVLVSVAVVSSLSSEPHATAVTATSVSPAMATGIRVMLQVCLVMSTTTGRRPTFAGSTASRKGRHDVPSPRSDLLIL